MSERRLVPTGRSSRGIAKHLRCEAIVSRDASKGGTAWVFFLVVMMVQASFLGAAPRALRVHKAHLSSSWYSHDKKELSRSLQDYASLAKKNFPVKVSPSSIRAVIVPHAGHRFSGLCATSVFSNLEQAKNIEKVIILAPSHAGGFSGIALPDYDTYKTVLGDISVAKKLPAPNSLFKIFPGAHDREHSIEVELPFLQTFLKRISIVEGCALIPLVVGSLGKSDFDKAAQAIAKLIDKKTLVVVSSDFIHYGPRFRYMPGFENIRRFDSRAIEAISEISFSKFDSVLKETGATICGKNAIKILLKLIEMGALGDVECRLACYYTSPQIEKARKRKKIDISQLFKTVKDRNSVSYAGLIFTKEKLSSLKQKDSLTGYEKKALLKLARDVIANEFAGKKLEKKQLYPILSPGLKQFAGAFVTLNTKSGKLRGCIGRISADLPLYKVVSSVAKSSAFRDHRFRPLKKGELDNIAIEITVLGKPFQIKSYKNIKLGTHGIILKKRLRGRMASAVFLPHVPTEFGWDLKTTLEHLSNKAGIGKDGYKSDCQFEVFEGFKFSS